MKIRKAHILARHFHNMEDDSAGILYTEEDGGVDWLWDVIQDTVGRGRRREHPNQHFVLLIKCTLRNTTQ